MKRLPCCGHQDPGRRAFSQRGAEAASSQEVRFVLSFKTYFMVSGFAASP